jgi:hypothetical protein
MNGRQGSFFDKHKDLFQYDEYTSNDENIQLKLHLLTNETSVSMNSLPDSLETQQQQQQQNSSNHSKLRSFGLSTRDNNNTRMMTMTGGVTPRSPRSLQLEALEQSQRAEAIGDKLFHHNVLFSPIRNSSTNTNSDDSSISPLNSARSSFGKPLKNKADQLFGKEGEQDLLSRAVDRANKLSPYKSPRQRLAQLTLARKQYYGNRYNGPNTPNAPNYGELNIEKMQKQQQPQQLRQHPQHPQQPQQNQMNNNEIADSSLNNMAYTGLSLQSNASTPNSSVLPSARSATTIDSDAPDLGEPLRTGMAAPFLGYGQGETHRRTGTIMNDQQRRLSAKTVEPLPKQEKRWHWPPSNNNLYGGKDQHPLGKISDINPAGILPVPGDMLLDPNSPTRTGKRTFTNQERSNIQSSAAGYIGSNVIRPGRAYVPEPRHSTNDLNHLLISPNNPSISVGFNPDIAPKKRLNLSMYGEEERHIVLQKLKKFVLQTTGKRFTGYISEIPPCIMRRMGLNGNGLKLKERKVILSKLFENDKLKYDAERSRQNNMKDFGLNYPFKLL